ncbi:MAG: diaminobutyrate decarboxylase [Saprospiraceae bacterium]|nr:diaminobutyrate decarboxylase [Saprospiraceae bacterium]
MKHSDDLDFQEVGQMVVKKLASYLDASRSGSSPVVDLRSMADMVKDLQFEEFLGQKGMNLEALSSFLDTYLQDSMHVHHPGYIGHQVAVPNVASAIADLVHGAINNPMSIFEMGPAAATIEHQLIRWMLTKVAWEKGAGVFTHGGSMANIHAMLAARAAIAPEAWQKGNPPNLVVLAPENSHYSIARAISILGMGSESILTIPTDRNEVVIPDAIPQVIEAARERGQMTMALIANVAATSTGLYDPLEEIGLCCNEYDCWLHMDSPHGIAAILSAKYQHLLAGIELADSLIWDAHKMMQTSTLCTAVLFKEEAHLMQTFSQKGSYLFYEKENQGVDSLPYQLECTKAPLATKLFLTLAITGEQGMADFVDAVYDKARIFAKYMSARQGFSIVIPIEANIVCFQYLPNKIDQLQLREKLVKRGMFYISSTEIKGTRYLRLVVMNALTDLDTITGLLVEIETVGGQLLQT